MTNFFEKVQQGTQPQIRTESHAALTKLPDEEEVRAAIFQMGPDKCPGPDGMTPRVYQQYWDIFKKDVTSAIQKAFATGEVPSDWLRSNIVLIPKNNEPQKPKEYRPITIGNTIYRLLMKILANRLQPLMAQIISPNQSAFLRGRNIADNTILIQEIVHSFQSSTFNKEAFLLKADVNKAFDMLAWPFVRRTMEAVNMPPVLVNLIMGCLRAGKVTVLVNGRGSGFISPTRGLRQGCPVSPYIFILAMEFLSRLFRFHQQKGDITGLKIARTAPCLTHSMYADDLIIMGTARIQEVRKIKNLLTEFETYSGLGINPDKSTIWFSNVCSEECKQGIIAKLQAKEAGENEKYLGVVIARQAQQADLTHEMLVEKMMSKLAGWKVNILSFAGRVTLIKPVLVAIPVYYMTVAVLPTKTVNEINSLLRKFLWVKLGQDRYMAMVGWHKICLPIEEGGLGI